MQVYILPSSDAYYHQNEKGIWELRKVRTHLGKLTWWKAFQRTTTDVVQYLSNLGASPDISKETRSLLEKFICQLYIPNTLIVDIGEARWWLFTKKQFYDERLPPTTAALEPAIDRANLQAMIWNQSLKQYPVIPSP